MNSNLTFCLGGMFLEKNQNALMEVVDAMSKKQGFDYEWVTNPQESNLVFFEDTAEGFPKGLFVPQIILSSGRTYHSPEQNQHRATWGDIERILCLLANSILQDRMLKPVSSP